MFRFWPQKVKGSICIVIYLLETFQIFTISI